MPYPLLFVGFDSRIPKTLVDQNFMTINELKFDPARFSPLQAGVEGSVYRSKSGFVLGRISDLRWKDLEIRRAIERLRD
jgi:hypothetical protein